MTGPDRTPELADDLIDRVDALDRRELDALVDYLDARLEVQEGGVAGREVDADEQEPAADEAPGHDLPPGVDRDDDVPAKATLTTKTIKGNDYYYWQWRDGDEIKSEYVGPVGG